MSNLQNAIRQCEATLQMLQGLASNEPAAADFDGPLMNVIDALPDLIREMQAADAMKAAGVHDTKLDAEMSSGQEPREEKGEEDGDEPIELKSAGAHTLYR